jgi:hypothetical protein
MSHRDQVEQERKRREEEAARMRPINNPRNEPTGHFTGRCSRCGSDDLWDDNLHYGCNSCRAFLA